jgi:hypothetical protein
MCAPERPLSISNCTIERMPPLISRKMFVMDHPVVDLFLQFRIA